MNDSNDTRYVCTVCNAAYDAETAAAMSFVCHDVPLESSTPARRARRARHEQTAQDEPQATSPRESFVSSMRRIATRPTEPPLFPEQGEQAVIEIVPPRVNEKNAQAVKTLLASLSVGQPFSLEIASDSNGRRFLVRGAPSTLEHIAHQVRAVYGQVECIQVTCEDDPAEALTRALQLGRAGQAERMVAAGRMKLRRPEFFPLRTFEDLTEGDPILPVLGSLAGLRNDEHALAQIVLSPARDSWADLYQGLAQNKSPQAQAVSPPGQLKIALLAMGVLWGVVALGLLLAAQGSAIGMVSLAILTAVIWGGLMWLGQKISLTMNANPVAIQRKVEETGYLADIRLWAAAPEAAQARLLLGRLAGAYRSFNLAAGNALELVADGLPDTPHDLSRESLRRAQVLNISELATMWHLPLGENPDQVRHGLYQRFAPLPSTVSSPGSVRIGQAVKGGQVIPVALSPLAAGHNTLILGKTQKGKTTVAGVLAQSIMAKPNHALVVIAPHRDFADGLLGLVPESRVDDMVYIDLGREDRSVGLNLLDTFGLRMQPDKIVSDLISLGRTIWKDYWGPRMESALSYAAQTLAYANTRLKPEEQFTLLDLPYLLYADDTFRKFVLANLIQEQDIKAWWVEYYHNSLTNTFRQEIINPVLTKVHAFSRARAVRNVVAQSRSTVDVRDAIARGKIVIVHTAPGEIGADIGGFMGAVMLNYLNTAVREQIALDRPDRARVTVIIDEFQSIPGVDYGALLSELLKMGANFILANQALAQLDAISPALRGSVFANIDTLVAFQTSGEDADYLYNELDQQVKPPDLTNLRPHECYLKTIDQDGNRLPVVQMETLAPPPGSADVARRIQELTARYTAPADQVKADLEAHMSRCRQDAIKLEQTIEQLAQENPLDDIYEQFGDEVKQKGSLGQDAMAKRARSAPPSG